MTATRAERREKLAGLLQSVRAQFDMGQSLTARDRLSMMTTLHCERVHPDDRETVEEAVEYVDKMHSDILAVDGLSALLSDNERMEKALRGLVERGTDSPEHRAAEAALEDPS